MNLALGSPLHGSPSDICAFGKENRICFVLKVFAPLPSKVNFSAPCFVLRNAAVIKAVASFQPKHFVESKAKQDDESQLDSNTNFKDENTVTRDKELKLRSTSNFQKFLSPFEESCEKNEREIIRRMRLSKANKGKVPWNKGKKHSAETLRLIREKTRLAMQDPKVKMKLVNLGHAQSEETKKKIGAGVRIGWERRHKMLMAQETCHLEWQNLIADASRKGFVDEAELQWDSYSVLDNRLNQEWLESIEKRKSSPRTKANKRAPKSLEQRKKISKAISSKWADPEYRDRVCSALAKYHGTKPKAVRKPREKPSNETLNVTRKPENKRARKKSANVGNESIIHIVSRKRQTRNLIPSFKDPQADSKRAMLKKIRDQRALMEAKRKEATKRAKQLTAQAEKAAKVLEALAMKSTVAQASLLETRRLIAEATRWIESVESGVITPDMDVAESSSSMAKGSPIHPNGKAHNALTASGEITFDDGLHSILFEEPIAHLRGNSSLNSSMAARFKGEEPHVNWNLNGKNAVAAAAAAVSRGRKQWVGGRLVEVADDLLDRN